MKKFKYSIRKKADTDGKNIFELLKNEEVILTSEIEYELKHILNSDGVDYNDEEIINNISRYKREINTKRINEILAKYEAPGRSTDTYLVIIILLTFIGYFFALSSGQGFFGINEPLTFIILTLVLVTSLVIYSALLNSRKFDRNLMARLDEVEKKLDMYKKGIEKDENKQESN